MPSAKADGEFDSILTKLQLASKFFMHQKIKRFLRVSINQKSSFGMP